MRKFTGEITYLTESYGFLRDNEDNFRWFHEKYVKDPSFDDLRIGERVEFTPFVGPRGRRAEDIKLLDPTRRQMQGFQGRAMKTNTFNGIKKKESVRRK